MTMRTVRRATADDWNMSKEVVTPNKIKRAINSFDPYKSPGLDGIQPVHLQGRLAAPTNSD
jgi:hypothetical protein